MRALVTGGGGQLGRAFARLLPDAVVFDRSGLDITDAAAVNRTMDDIRPDVVFNTAAYTAVDRAESEPEQARRVNVDAVAALAGAARRIDALLVQFSSDYVFSGDRGPYTESDPTGPLSVYGRTKLDGETAARRAGDRHLVIRTSWVFGDGHNFIRSILGAAGKYEELTVVDDQRGRPTYAPDLAAATLALVEGERSGTFNLSGGGAPGTWADVAEVAIESAGLSAGVRRITTRQYYAGKQGPIAPRPANSELDCSKASEAGVSLRPWPQAVAEYVKELELS